MIEFCFRECFVEDFFFKAQVLSTVILGNEASCEEKKCSAHLKIQPTRYLS